MFKVQGYTKLEQDEPLNKTNRFFSSKLVSLYVISTAVLLVLWNLGNSDELKPTLKLYQTSRNAVENGKRDKLSHINQATLLKRGFLKKQAVAGKTEDSKNTPHTIDTTIYVNTDVKFQEIIGFGGAFTESAAYNFYNLNETYREQILELYWGDTGIGYTMGRLPINSCDFSLTSYNFDDVPGDYELKYFDMNVTHDTEVMIPFILAAMAKVKASNTNKDYVTKPGQYIRLVSSPWSPPPWMKVPQNGVQMMNGSATPNGLIATPENMAAWALYLSKFIEAYSLKGIDIWGLTPQNEPLFAAPWEACYYNVSFSHFFVNEYLGPTIRARNPDINILAYDHNKDYLLQWTQFMLGAGNNSMNYVDGMAFHWYEGSGNRLLDGTFGYGAVYDSYWSFGRSSR